jgi:effector-binding domain-containing protein
MKFLRPLATLMVFIIIVTAALSFLLPTSQKIERTTTINAPAAVIYEKLRKLENFNQISVWNQRDSSVVQKLEGTDGTTGAITSWSGDPEISGTGKMTITSLEPNKKIVHAIEFTTPKKGKAVSTITLSESKGSTTVTWQFIKATPRPWNIFNLLYSLDEEKGDDFEAGLLSLKKITEPVTATTTSPAPEIKLLNFPATTYAIVRQQISWSDIPSFHAAHQPLLITEAAKLNITAGTPSSLIYSWDEKLRQADIAAAIPVPSGTVIENNIIRVIDIPASKAVYADHLGSVEKTADLYPSIRKYLSDNKLREISPLIEQYLSDPAKETDSSKWKTRVIFLVE